MLLEDNTRNVYGSERTCRNCIHQEVCWQENTEIGIPGEFRLRASWEASAFKPFMKDIYGQICGVFLHSNTELRNSFAAAEERKLRAINLTRDWD